MKKISVNIILVMIGVLLINLELYGQMDISPTESSIEKSQSESSDKVEELIKVLNNDASEESARNTAVMALGELKDPRAIGPLIDLLKKINSSTDRMRPNNIAYALEQITDQDFGTDVEKWQKWWIQFQKDSQPIKAAEIAKRKEVLKTYGKNQDRSAIPFILEALKDENADIRTSASWALANIADKSTVPELIRILKDEDYRVRGNAAWALGVLGDESAISPLIETLRDQRREVRRNTNISLANIGKKAVPVLLDALEKEQLSPEENERAWAIHGIAIALSDIGDKSAVPYLYKLLEDEDGNVAFFGAEALCNMRDETVVYDLIKFAAQKTKDIDEKKVKMKAQELEEAGADGMTRFVTALSFLNVPIAIFDGIRSMGENAFPILIKALKDKDPAVRSFTIASLNDLFSSHPNYQETIIESFIDLLSDENPEVRQKAQRCLEEITDLKYNTGQDFRGDKRKWQEWWSKSKSQFN